MAWQHNPARWVALALVLGALAHAEPSGEPFTVSPKGGAMLVQVEVNGKHRTLIVDTGAQFTILDIRALNMAQQFELKKAEVAGPKVGTYGISRTVTAKLCVAGKCWDNRAFVGMNLQPVSDRYGTRIDGLLGLDVLTEFEAVTLDFKAKRLRIEGKE